MTAGCQGRWTETSAAGCWGSTITGGGFRPTAPPHRPRYDPTDQRSDRIRRGTASQSAPACRTSLACEDESGTRWVRRDSNPHAPDKGAGDFKSPVSAIPPLTRWRRPDRQGHDRRQVAQATTWTSRTTCSAPSRCTRLRIISKSSTRNGSAAVLARDRRGVVPPPSDLVRIWDL